MISMAPDVADASARRTAIAGFPLGQTIGGMWYEMFGVGASPWQMSVTIAGLVMIGSVVAAFAGVLADPVQVCLGIHRRRLGRLLDTREGELVGRGDEPVVAREHFFARVLDFWDTVVSAVRMFRS